MMSTMLANFALAAQAEPVVSTVGALGTYLVHFFLVSLVVASATAAIRIDEPRHIWQETRHFFIQIVVGIGILCLVVFIVEWVFVRPLV